MNIVASLLIVLSLFLGAPDICDHRAAASGEKTGTMASHSMDHADHGATSHENSKAHHQTDTEHHDNHPCPDNCLGGVNCEGCAMTVSALVTSDRELARPVMTAKVIDKARADISITFTLDPPPPRLTLFI
ncbi:MAG: hypothetical protein AAGJ73_10960 [Pseudomonadota bacterium]